MGISDFIMAGGEYVRCCYKGVQRQTRQRDLLEKIELRRARAHTHIHDARSLMTLALLGSLDQWRQRPDRVSIDDKRMLQQHCGCWTLLCIDLQALV